MSDYILLNDKGEPDDILISLSKIFALVKHQIKYYDEALQEHELKGTEMYLLGKPDKTYNELLTRKDEWEWLNNHLLEAWPSLIHKNKL